MANKLPVEQVLEILDETVARVSRTAVEFAGRMTEDEDLPCIYQWQKLDKAAAALLRAREIENETLAAISVLNAEKELVSRAVALMECLTSAEGKKESAPNLRHPLRKSRKHPWGRSAGDDN